LLVQNDLKNATLITINKLPLTFISFSMGWTSVVRQPMQMPIDLLKMKIRTKAQFVTSC